MSPVPDLLSWPGIGYGEESKTAVVGSADPRWNRLANWTRLDGAEPPTDQAALRDVWDVYDGQYPVIDQTIGAALGPKPELAGKILQLRSLGGSRDTAHQLVQDALTRGQWTPYLESMAAQGERYGQRGVPLALWLLLWRLFRIALRECLLATYGDDAS